MSLAPCLQICTAAVAIAAHE